MLVWLAMVFTFELGRCLCAEQSDDDFWDHDNAVGADVPVKPSAIRTASGGTYHAVAVDTSDALAGEPPDHQLDSPAERVFMYLQVHTCWGSTQSCLHC